MIRVRREPGDQRRGWPCQEGPKPLAGRGHPAGSTVPVSKRTIRSSERRLRMLV
jgi:hypothetical protein